MLVILTFGIVENINMKIALDYDQTFDQDKEFWAKVVNLAKEHGHIVTIVTGRVNSDFGNEDILSDAKNMGIDVVFCSQIPKSEKFTADVWIDDSPLNIISTETMKAMIALDKFAK